MMKTPICDFIEAYASGDNVRLHMPGHKGRELLGFEKYDITEMSGADALFLADGIIKQSEDNLTSIFDTGRSLYSCEGSSLCVRAMLYLARLYKGNGYVLASRNAHSSFVSALALLDLDVKWLCDDKKTSYMSACVTPEMLEKSLLECEGKPICVYITSPDYLGVISDISGIARVCEAYGVLLLVDNAHGAYLKFLESDTHPISLGAHMCCDSAHKTLPALTGGAYLHISKNAPAPLIENAKDAMALFASTSPSYLILASLDRVNKYLCDGYGARLGDFIKKVNELKKALAKGGYTLLDSEPLKLVIMANEYGYTGNELASKLEKSGIFCEMADNEHLVLMLTPENTQFELERLLSPLLKIEKRPKISAPVFEFELPVREMSVREALMLPREKIPLDRAVGRISASLNCFCPPAISIVVAGERIGKGALAQMKHYGYKEISVLK